MGFFKRIFGPETEGKKARGNRQGTDCLTALSLHLQGDSDQALAAYQELTAESPDQRLPRFLAAVVKAQKEDVGDAAADLRSLSAMIAEAGETISGAIHQELLAAVQEGFIPKGAPTAAEMVTSCGDAFKKENYLRESAVCFEIASALVPDNAHILHKLGDTLHDLRMYEYAEEVLRQALEHAPYHWGALYTYGVLLQDLGRDEEALACYEQAASIDPDHATCRNNYGSALFRVNRIEEALEQCTAAERLAPDYPFVKINLGNIYLVMKDFVRSADCFREAIRLNPNLAAGYLGLASAEKAMGGNESTVRELHQKAIELDPRISELLQSREGSAAAN